jgi:hypothetical protein
MDGQILDSQETKVHTIVQLEETLTLEELLLMHITNVAFMLELKFQEQTQKFFLVNGNSKLGLVLELSKGITYGLQDIFCKDVPRNTICQ